MNIHYLEMRSHKAQLFGLDGFGKEFKKKNSEKYSIIFNDPLLNKGMTLHFNNIENSLPEDAFC